MSQRVQSKRSKSSKHKPRKIKVQGVAGLPMARPHTAGIDIGAMEIFVGVSPELDSEPVGSFGTFTQDLEEIAKWLESCGVTSVAMESTGVYWIPLYQILVDRKMAVCLVNARHFHNVPGRKTDVMDCQWLQYLHSVGLLRGSFRPEQEVCAVRTLLRHRQSLVQMAAVHTMHMQKAMEQMNVKLSHVISDITGVTGMRIIDAILAGERDPRELAKLRHATIRADEETIMRSLGGDYRAEHLLTLEQSVAGYRFYQKQMAELDQKMEGFMEAIPAKIDLREHPLPQEAKKGKRQHNAPAYDLRSHCYRAFGVDLTQVPGFDGPTIQVMLAEVGPGADEVSQWIGICQLADAVTQQCHNRREDSVLENPERQEPSCVGITASGSDGGEKRKLHRPILPTDAWPTGPGRGDHRCSPQTRTDLLRSGPKGRGVRRIQAYPS